MKAVAFASLGVAVVLGCAGYSLAAASVEHGNVAFDVAPRGSRIVFSAADGDLYTLDLKTQALLRLTKTAQVESAPTFSPDGKSIAYSGSAGSASHIYIRSLDGKVQRQLTSGQSTNDASPSFSSDGSRIVFVRAHRHRPYSMGGWTWDNWDVCVMKRDGTQQRRLTRQNYYQASNPRFIEGGQTVVYSAEGGAGDEPLVSKLFAVGAVGKGAPRVLTPERRRKVVPPEDFGTLGSQPDASPDGRRLVFLSDRAAAYAYDLYTMSARGTKPTSLKITGISRYNSNPVFASDGRSVLFLAGTQSNASARPIFSLWRVGLDGKNARRVAGSGLFTEPTKWRPGR